MVRSGTRRSSSSDVAVNPPSRSPSPPRSTATTLPCAQWWFVSTSPFGETKDAEHPGIRSEASRARSNHAASGRKPYVLFQVLGRGVLEQPHLPAVERPGADGVGVERERRLGESRRGEQDEGEESAHGGG